MTAPAVIALDESAIMLAASAVATTEHLRDQRLDLVAAINEISQVMAGLAERGPSTDPLATATALLATTTLNWALAEDASGNPDDDIMRHWQAAALSLAKLVRRLSLRN